VDKLKLSQVDLNLLVALDALLRERNVTRAGRQIGLSQPAMSAALSHLRDLFGDKLFERVGSEHRLTPFAEALAEPLQVALAAIERTLDRDASFDPKTAARRFRLAMSDHLMLVLCPALVQRVHQLAPGIELHVQQVTPEIGKHLAARRVELSIQPHHLVTGVHAEPLYEDTWTCAVWRGNDAVKAKLTAEQLCSLPHVSFISGPTSLAERLITPHLGKRPLVQVTTQSFVPLPFMLRGTQRIALIQRSLGAYVQEIADIRLLELPIPVPAVVFEMSWNPLYSTDPAHTWLRGVISEVAKTSCAVVPA
jgi:DNA-binding transcriptional LysR family regulator